MKAIHNNVQSFSTIGIIGCGNMGQALAKLFTEKNYDVVVSARTKDTLNNINLNVVKLLDNKKLVSLSDLVIVAVKPNDVFSVLDELRDVLKDKIVVSIAAGISLDDLEKRYSSVKFVWLMPNILAQIGKLVGGFMLGRGLNTADVSKVVSFFDDIGMLYKVSEDERHALTVLTGCGPAFIAYFVKAVLSGVVKNGFDEAKAKSLFIETMKGTAELLNIISPDVIIRKVASPGGVTEKGLLSMNKNKVDVHIENAVEDAINKSMNY